MDFIKSEKYLDHPVMWCFPTFNLQSTYMTICIYNHEDNYDITTCQVFPSFSWD